MQGADALERATKVRIVVFDKTGTLTKGSPAVTDHCVFAEDFPVEEFLHLAAAAEASSEHPLAKAVLAYARAWLATGSSALDLDPQPGSPSAAAGPGDDAARDTAWIRQARDAESLAGRGVKCWVRQQQDGGSSREVRVLVGSRRLMAEEGVPVPR